MSLLKNRVKSLLFALLGKDPEGVVVSFASASPERVSAMVEEVRRLVPDRRHFVVSVGEPPETGGGSDDRCARTATVPAAIVEEPSLPDTGAASPVPALIPLAPGSVWRLYRQLRRALRRYRIGLAPVLFDGDRRHEPLRRAAFLYAPARVLAYNAKLERHHPRLRHWIASWLFLRGTPLDRIYLRPRWLYPWKRDRSVYPDDVRVLEGRPASPGRRRVAVLSPYFPYPLSHGGAVRIYHLLREAARDCDIYMFAFTEDEWPQETALVTEFCAKVTLVPKPRYREPRWASLDPPEVCEYRSPAMRRVLDEARREHGLDTLQVEYTCLASYGGEILVEHDVTWDLYRQVHERERTLSSWWDWWRWRRFETQAVRKYGRVVAMSEKDAGLLGVSHCTVIPNGVDLGRFRPEPESAGQRLLFIGSFRHFPNVTAYRFFVERVWPSLRDRFPEMALTVVAGPDPMTYWRACADSAEPPRESRIRLLEFVRDVRPLYVESNLVIVPTLVSAGTNVKVLEAMAMERAVVSTPSGCAGLGLEHGVSVWVADGAAEFAEGIAKLAADPDLRKRMARAARLHAERHFDWRRIGERQRALLAPARQAEILVRAGEKPDLEAIGQIQSASPEAARWEPARYLEYQCRVAEMEGRVAGFVVWRTVAEGESEILNLAVDPARRRLGVAGRLLRQALAEAGGDVFLEVRESNHAARNLYSAHGFRDAGLRRKYYRDPEEDAVVMRLRSC